MDNNGIQDEDVEAVLHTSGSLGRLVSFKYDGRERVCEPYSLRDGKDGQLFYGYDLKRDAIRAFKLSRMTDVEVSGSSFVPKYPVELGERTPSSSPNHRQGSPDHAGLLQDDV